MAQIKIEEFLRIPELPHFHYHPFQQEFLDQGSYLASSKASSQAEQQFQYVEPQVPES